jgi:alpha/beta superfamily hydrolase
MAAVTDLIGPAGALEALLDEPDRPEGNDRPIKAAVVFAHPHPQFGGTMHTKVVYRGAKGLTRIGCAVLRFNFRGVGRSQGTFDQGEGEQEDFNTERQRAKPPTRHFYNEGPKTGNLEL